MEDRLLRYVDEHDLLLPPARAVLGLSGGIDSVVLFRLLRAAGIELHVVHVNYALREAADGDEAFARRLCRREDVPLTVRRRPIEGDATREGRSVQELARRVRYEVFEAVAREHGISRVAVGHQMDDQIETMLLQLVRGTGLRGLAGMPVRRPISRGSPVEVVRPLLFARRSEIAAYAAQQEWDWRVDASNRSTGYLRTALRHEVLPRLEEQVGSGGMENIARAADRVREYVEEEWQPRLDRALQRSVEMRADGTIRLLVGPLNEASTVWRQEIVLETIRRNCPELPISTAVVEEVTALLDAQVGRRKAYASHTVWRERGHILFVPAAGVPAPVDRRIEPGETVELPGAGRVSLERVDDGVPRPPPQDPNTALVDAREVVLPLGVRPWREGDRLRPLGMDGHKNVSDLLTDAKIPSHRRDRVYVVTSEDHVIWIVGVRLAHHVRITSRTESALRLSFWPPAS